LQATCDAIAWFRVRVKNKFAFLSVKAPVWQGTKALEYQDISSFRNAARQDEWAFENVRLFFREPLTLQRIFYVQPSGQPDSFLAM
jgi:hypothetical protein